MIMYLMAIRFEIWDTVKTSYIGPTTSLVDAVGNKIDENNTKSMNAILCGLAKSKFSRVLHYKSEKYMWYKLHTIY